MKSNRITTKVQPWQKQNWSQQIWQLNDLDFRGVLNLSENEFVKLSVVERQKADERLTKLNHQ